MGSKVNRFFESALRTVDKYTDPANLRGAHDRYDRMRDERREDAKNHMREEVHAELREEQGNPDVLTRPNDTVPNKDPYGYGDMREEIYSELPERGTFIYGQQGGIQQGTTGTPQGQPPQGSMQQPVRDFSGRSGNPFAGTARDAGFTDFNKTQQAPNMNNRSLAQALRQRGGAFGGNGGY